MKMEYAKAVTVPTLVAQVRNDFLTKPSNVQEIFDTLSASDKVGLVIVEATAVSAIGRITPGDVGLWSDGHVSGLSSVARSIKGAGAVAGIQLGHAGRKSGCTPLWDGGAPLAETDPQAWQPEAPSAVPLMAGAPHLPSEMTLEDIKRT